jgi:hypothetical protein
MGVSLVDGETTEMNIFKPHELPALDPEEFKGVLGLAMRAADKQINSPHPPDHGINLRADDGTVSRISLTDHPMYRTGLAVAEEYGADDGAVSRLSLTDHPMNRAGLAVAEEYGADHDLFQNIMFRISAFTVALDEPPMQKWKKPNPDAPDSFLLHSAAIEAAALTPLKADGLFDSAKLDQKTKEIAERKYSDLE